MKRRDALMRMCGLGGVVGATFKQFPTKPLIGEEELRQWRESDHPCPVCKERYAYMETTLAETTTIFTDDRTYLPLSNIYLHRGGKRCSVKVNRVAKARHGPVHRTATKEGDHWKEIYFSPDTCP